MGRCLDRDYWDHILSENNIKPPTERHHRHDNTIVITLKGENIVILDIDYEKILDGLKCQDSFFNDELEI